MCDEESYRISTGVGADIRQRIEERRPRIAEAQREIKAYEITEEAKYAPAPVVAPPAATMPTPAETVVTQAPPRQPQPASDLDNLDCPPPCFSPGGQRGLPLCLLFLALYVAAGVAYCGRYAKAPPPYFTPDQTTIDFPASAPEAVEEASAEVVAEGTTPGYSTAPGTKDMAGKIRTWVLYKPSGTKVAEITTKSGAEKTAAILNRAEGIKR